jgi:hypothetical protein
MPRFSWLLLALAVVISPACALTCSAPAAYTDPSGIKSKNAVCTKVHEKGTASAAAAAITGDFDATNLPGSEARKGKQMIDKLLAYMNDPDEMPTSDEIQAYGIAVGMLMVPPLIFLLLNCCCCYWCTCMHTCCKCCPTMCRCCKCIPSTNQYTWCEVFRPNLVWLIIALVYFVVAILGTINGVYKLADTSVNGICVMDNTYLRFDAFLTNVQAPLDKVKVDFTDAVTGMKDATEFDPALSKNIEDMAPMFEEISNLADEGKNAQTLAPCQAPWKELSAAATEAEASTTASANELKQTLDDIQKQIKSSIVDQSQAATDALDSGSTALSDMKSQLSKMMNPEKLNLFTVAKLQQDNRNNLAFGQFGWIFVAVVFTFASIIGMKFCSHERFMEQPPANNKNLPPQVKSLTCLGSCFARVGAISWFIVLTFGTFGALFALLFLPLTAVMSDACTVLPNLPGKLGEITGNAQVQNISDTCWSKDGNLFQGLNLDASIDVDSIDFSEFSSEFETPKIDKDGLDKMREAVTKIRDESPSQCNAPVNTAKANQVTDKINDIEDQIKKAEDAFADDPSAKKIKESGESLVTTLKCAVGSFKNVTKCYFIKTTWEEVTDLVCTGVNGSLAWIAIAELLIAIFAVPYAVTTLCILKRHGGHGPLSHDDDDFTDAVEIKEIEVSGFAY